MITPADNESTVPRHDLGETAETFVQYLFTQLGCEYVRTGAKTPALDGFLRLADPTGDRVYTVGVQVKTGASWIVDSTSKHHVMRVATRDVAAWHGCNHPVIIVWVSQSENLGRFALWSDARRVRLGRSRLRIHRRSRVDASAIDRILQLAHREAWGASVPALTQSPLRLTAFKQAKALAKMYFDAWRRHERGGTYSPVFGWVTISLHAWRHITRVSRSKDSILHRLALLPCASELLRSAHAATCLRVRQTVAERTELFAIRGISRLGHRADAMITVVVEVTERAGTRVTRLLSVYEQRPRDVGG
ncbi:MAG: DUF4365 domain-containing protein [Proteobacteria bacterium]|nr:DUF4365 domain-containing protein [Pseudomonadota bacterium]